MRQIGDELRVNPFNIIKCEFIGEASDEYRNKMHFNVFLANKTNEKALKFCAKQCWDSESEECANVCTNKFNTAFNMFHSEK